ncbi:MAG TPA: DNA polymerase III subunit beta [Patescibacteria group bacterium]|nr:DNA polymerase III subunit beta [Patescibacteria group bacterium]
MKITCTQENLKSGLVTVGKIISSSNTLPILANILLKTENGSLVISSTNLEIAITTQVRCRVEEEGLVTVSSKTFNELIGNLPNKNITLQTEQNSLKIEAENYHTAIKTLPAEEFPIIPEVDNGVRDSIDCQKLKNSLDQVVFAASNNQTQQEITGILFSNNGSGLTLVATDRYRLAEKKMVDGVKNLEYQAIIPQRTLNELSRIIGQQKGVVDLVVNETQVSLSLNDTKIVSRLVDGEYPDYKQIIPTTFPINAKVERQAFVGALRTAGVFSQSNSVRLVFSCTKGCVLLSAESPDLGKSEVELPADMSGGEEVGVILNFHYLLDCLSCITEERVELKVIGDSSPILVVPENSQDYTYLVMPIKS